MKRITLAVVSLFVLVACNTEQKKAKTPETKKAAVKVASKTYPADIQKVFDAHGGIDKWNEAQTLIYVMKKPKATERHITDLHSRKTRLEGTDFTVGFDGKDAWLVKEDSTAFKGNARFYYNLYFYFYAMPFVLGDDGITYDKAENLVYKDVSYPGYKISYGDGVGDSPEDNYFIYYNPKTYKMEWLGYTVTYYNGKPSTKVSYIRYGDWQKVNGVVLPKTITWHKSKDGKLMGERNSVEFTNVLLSNKVMENSMYERPVDGVVVPKG